MARLIAGPFCGRFMLDNRKGLIVMTDKTKVIFRKWKNGTIDALFPELPHDPNGFTCVAYSHVGQHSGADYHGVISQTKPAAPDEYAALARELTRIGYALDVVKREPRGAYQTRRAAALA
jgi:hypothetical protein